MKATVSLLTFFLLISSCNQTENKIEKYPNGQIKSEIEMKDNKKDGIAKYYYENGKLSAEAEYKNDTVVGVMKEFNENGTIYREVDIKTLDAKIYNADGSCYLIGKYDNDELVMNGTWEDWIKEFNYKRFDWTYANDAKHGPYTAYRKDGSIEAKGFYKNGNLSDTLKLYDEKGVLQAMEVWQVNPDGNGSTNMNTIYLTDKKPDGTVEVIEGKIYTWKDGKKTFMENLESK